MGDNTGGMYVFNLCYLFYLNLLVYGRLAHKDDLLQVSAGRPAPTIGSSELCITSVNILLSYVSSVYSSC